MERTEMKLAQMEITTPIPAGALPNSPRFLALAVARLKVLWRSAIGHTGIRRKPKTLSVRETAALGDRRFVSVIQFERQRFLIGSSPSSVTLLAQLPAESAGDGATGEKT